MLPTLKTRRLVLSPFTLDDAPEVQRMAGNHEVSRTTLHIPHPYPAGDAEKWIARHLLDFLERRSLTLAIRLAPSTLVGAIGLSLNMEHRHGELGYWIGREYWGNGYCTEAARELLRFAFDSLHLHRVMARYQSNNPASGRVMQKIGMTLEGTLRQHVFKNDQPQDVLLYGILATEHQGRPDSDRP